MFGRVLRSEDRWKEVGGNRESRDLERSMSSSLLQITGEIYIFRKFTSSGACEAGQRECVYSVQGVFLHVRLKTKH